MTVARKLPKAPRAAPHGRPNTAASERPAVPAYHHGNLREALIAAAEAILAERDAGLSTMSQAPLTLRDVARRAGVSHAAPYHHFASLDHLLAAVAASGFTRLGARMAQATATTPDARERLLRIAEAYVDTARAHPAQFRLMFGPMLRRSPDFPALQAAAGGAFAHVLAAAQAFAPTRGGDVALLGWSLSHGLANLLIDGAFAGLPVAVGDAATLARRFSALALAAASGEPPTPPSGDST